ncbi:histidine-type phosphatase [Terriglobus sp. TAA 43]|uniref:histidine-type phosphatase n=1 Tax=Terriglobus sp. TAA 43 TaxID=278961 RepID=UPI000646A49E|nr:histidine-type phosphatase [Terriglobus sp. TAA 43]
MYWKRIASLLVAASYVTLTAVAQARATSADDELRGVIVLVRHGVRAPIESEIRASSYNAQPWPAWPVEQGVLTPHGTKALNLLGEWYRTRYASLLDGSSCDKRGIYAESNTSQRTIASAHAMLDGLAPGCDIAVHQAAKGKRNRLFTGASGAAVNQQQLTDAVDGRMANNPDWYVHAFAVPMALMYHVMHDCTALDKDCDANTPDFRAVRVKDGKAMPRNAREENPVSLGADFAEHFLLEYTEGMAMEQVGWGRITRADLDQLMEMNTRYHDFMLRTPYSAQVVASNLADRIRATIEVTASGKAVPRELGVATDRFILLDGHDGNLSWLGGLLRVDWVLKDQTFNATPPGGGFVFEVHHSRSTGKNTVQISYVSQTLDQMRYLQPLTEQNGPSIAPVFVPGCSGPAPAYACSVEDFSRVVGGAIDTNFLEANDR